MPPLEHSFFTGLVIENRFLWNCYCCCLWNVGIITSKFIRFMKLSSESGGIPKKKKKNLLGVDEGFAPCIFFPCFRVVHPNNSSPTILVFSDHLFSTKFIFYPSSYHIFMFSYSPIIRFKRALNTGDGSSCCGFIIFS